MSAFSFANASIGVVIVCGVVAGQTTKRVSMGALDEQGNGDSGGLSSISANGRFIAFSSAASNFIPNDTNGWQDVFVRDHEGRLTWRVSVASSGAEGNYISLCPSISADGRLVAFQSASTNLVGGDTNGAYDIFVHDRQSGTTERVSVDSVGAQGSSDSQVPSISPDGRFIAFYSRATNLVAGDTNGVYDVFVRDRQNSTTELVSVATGGAQGDGKSQYASISADGRFVAFWSFASNLVTADTNGLGDIFVRDRSSGTTERVSVTTAGVEGNSQSWYFPSISANGRFVAFESYASDLVAGDTNHEPDVFVRDRQLGTTERASVRTNGGQGNSLSVQPSISGDGRFVSFWSFASNLVAGDTNATYDVFMRDRLLGTTVRESLATGGAQANVGGSAASMSTDGRFVVFESPATNLIVGDTNGRVDLFLRDRRPPPSAYCTSGTSSIGCSASISASANPSISLANACNITVTNVEGQHFGILCYGIDNSGFAPGPWAAGSTSVLCVKQPTQRTPIQNSGGASSTCNGSYVLDWNAYQSSNPLALGNPWLVETKVYAQAWFRDPPAVKATNLSNALEMIYVP